MGTFRRDIKLLKNYFSASVTALIVAPLLLPTLITLFLFRIVVEGLKVTRKLYVSRESRHLGRFVGPVAYPVIGTMVDMLFKDFYEWSGEMCKRWGDPLRLWYFGRPMVFICSYKYAIQLLSKSNFNGKLHDLDIIDMNTSSNLLSSTSASIHSDNRNLLLPAFSQIVEGSFPVFCEESRKLVKNLEDYADNGKVFNLLDHVMKCMFKMVARSGFGDGFISSDDDTEGIRHMNALHTIAKNMTLTTRILGTHPWEKSDFIYFNFCEEGKETRKAFAVINGFARHAIKRRHEQSKKLLIEAFIEDIPNSNFQTQICYLDVLLQLVNNGHLSDDDVANELNNFMRGAYNTTALAVCWTLLLLSFHPIHQQRCYDELSQWFTSCPKAGHSNPSSYLTKAISAADMKQMKYLELCLKESLRLFPPSPIFSRSSVGDIELDDGRIIPKGVDVLIFANLIHRDPQHFPDPDKFIPERHLKGSSPAFMPFSIGTRNCIGQVYGMNQAKVALAYLVMAFEWRAAPHLQTAEDVKIAYQGLLYPAEGIPLKIRRRSLDVVAPK